MFGLTPPKMSYHNYTADHQRRNSLYEASIWAPAQPQDHQFTLDLGTLAPSSAGAGNWSAFAATQGPFGYPPRQGPPQGLPQGHGQFQPLFQAQAQGSPFQHEPHFQDPHFQDSHFQEPYFQENQFQTAQAQLTQAHMTQAQTSYMPWESPPAWRRSFAESSPPEPEPRFDPYRRHSYGDVYGYKEPAPAKVPVSANTFRLQSFVQDEDSMTLAAVQEYFTADPHERVQVTADYLAQRFFDEERYLGDSYQLPKFPVENLLRNYQLVLLGFKAGRVDVFYLPANVPGLSGVGVGDLVVVEADRGRDLGRIVKMNISIDEARLLKLLQFLEQQAALSDGLVGELLVKLLQHHHHGHGNHGTTPPTLHFPKSITALAQRSEILQILNKRQDEEKACRLCLTKIASTATALSSNENSTGLLTSSDLLQIKLIDAEYQFDRKKLIFYYSTSKRIDFRDLVRELFRIYKTRIWMCAVNGIAYQPTKKPVLPSSHPRSTVLGLQGLSLGQSPNKNQAARTHGLNENSTQAPLGQSYSLGPSMFNGSPSQPFGHNRPLHPGFAQRDAEGMVSVPRKFPSGENCIVEEEANMRDSGESLVLKSLVDTLNH